MNVILTADPHRHLAPLCGAKSSHPPPADLMV